MSTDFHLAPTQNAPSGATTGPNTPTTQTSTPAPRKPKATAAPESTVAGAVIPGAALTGLISLCWLIHQFGLPAVLLGIIACAAAATAALVLKARKGTKRVTNARKSAAQSAGGGGPGRTVLKKGTGGGKTTAPRRTAAGPIGGGGGARRTGGAASTKTPAGSSAAKAPSRKPLASAKPTGSLGGSAKTTPSSKTGGRGSLGPKNNTPKRGGLLTGLRGKTPKTTAPTGPSTRASKKPTPTAPTQAGGGKHRKNTPTTPAQGGKAGLLTRIAARKTRPLTGTAPASKGGTKVLDKATKAGRKLAPNSNAAKANTAVKKPRTPKPEHLNTKSAKPISPRKAARAAAKGKTPKQKTVKTKRAPMAPMSQLRRAQYKAGTKLRKHISKKNRKRIRRVISPARTAARTTGRILSKPTAYAWRYGARALLTLHMQLGTIRYTSAGPNWIQPMAKVLHAITSPAARLVAATGTWGWLNKWMYRHTSAPTTSTAPQPIPQTTAPAPAPAPAEATIPHQPVTTPAPTLTGAADMTYAAPLEQAADAVRQAGAMLLTSPAENMVGYEQTLHALATLQEAIGDVVRHAGETTRENFKVNPAIAEAYDDTASYASNLAQRLTEIPTLFRQLHEEQIDNIENPTVQARKWDISANE